MNILFGSSRASKDKCFLLLPLLLPRAVLGALHSSWEPAEPISAGLAGVVLPEGGGQSCSLGAEGRELWGDPTQHNCAQGLEVSSAYAGSGANQPDLSDRWMSPSILGIHSYRQISSAVCFYHLNSTCDTRDGSPIWGTDELVFKEHWKKRYNCGCLAINKKLNHTVCDAPYK